MSGRPPIPRRRLRVPDRTTLLRWAQAIRLFTLQALPDRAASLAKQAKISRGRKLRIERSSEGRARWAELERRRQEVLREREVCGPPARGDDAGRGSLPASAGPAAWPG